MTEFDYREIRLRDGRLLAYSEYGSMRGLPIIHCHGTPSARVEGDLILDVTVAIELGLRIIVPDRPGMGRSDFQAGRRIVDWPNDVLELAAALGLDTFAVLGSSGGAPYAAACGALLPNRIRVVGLLGGVAPVDGHGVFAAMSPPLRIMVRLARFAPAVLRGLFRLNLRAMSGGGTRGSDRMAASLPEPDRTLMKRPEIRDGFMACFRESCRQGPRGPVWDVALMARPWGFDLAAIKVPVLL
jgi:pimeloyl-ACP methyl ester carboxylesterase